MSKRFSETAKWDDPWFRKLTPKQKCLWQYFCDRCDVAGVLDFDPELARCHIGEEITETDLSALNSRICKMENGKYAIPKFIQFQYGKLSETCPAHQKALNLVKTYGFNNQGIRVPVRVPIPLTVRELNSQQEEEEVEVEVQEEDKKGESEGGQVPVQAQRKENPPKTPEALKIAELFKRKATTEWSPKEIAAFKTAKPHNDELEVVARYYEAERAKGPEGHHRRDMATFLNNYRGEVDRASAWKPPDIIKSRRSAI